MPPTPAERRRRLVHHAMAALLAAGGLGLGCGGSPGPESPGGGGTSSPRLPPPPPTASQSLGPNQPPVIWLGGTVEAATTDRLELQEGSGSIVTLLRLGQGATAFFRVSGDRWVRLPRQVDIESGERACVETLLDGTSLLALRVFLGAGCGPT